MGRLEPQQGNSILCSSQRTHGKFRLAKNSKVAYFPAKCLRWFTWTSQRAFQLYRARTLHQSSSHTVVEELFRASSQTLEMLQPVDDGVSRPWRIRCVNERVTGPLGSFISSKLPHRLHGCFCGARVRSVHQSSAELSSWRVLLPVLPRSCLSASLW